MWPAVQNDLNISWI